MAAFKSNPLLYRTFRNVTPSEIKNFHCKDMIEFHEGEEVETIKVVADHLPGKPIVAFAICFYGPKPPRDVTPPAEADFKFIHKVKEQTQHHTQQFYRENKDISKF